MSKSRLVMSVIFSALLLGAMVTVSEAAGSDSRAFINTNGTDAGNCTSGDPCRTITYALTQLANNGEIVIQNSGGYGAATISQGVTISAEGIHAAITATTGSGLTVDAPGDVVTIRGLTIIGQQSATSVDGVTVTSVGTLYLQCLTIEGFHNDGVNMEGGSLFFQDSDVRKCANDGLQVSGSGTNAYVHNTNFSFNTNAGVEADQGTSVTVAAGASNHNGTGFLSNASSSNSLVLLNDHAIGNTTGLATTGTGSMITFDHMLITQNTTGINAGAGTTVTGTNPGTSLNANNGTQLVGSLQAGFVLD